MFRTTDRFLPVTRLPRNRSKYDLVARVVLKQTVGKCRSDYEQYASRALGSHGRWRRERDRRCEERQFSSPGRAPGKRPDGGWCGPTQKKGARLRWWACVPPARPPSRRAAPQTDCATTRSGAQQARVWPSGLMRHDECRHRDTKETLRETVRLGSRRDRANGRATPTQRREQENSPANLHPTLPYSFSAPCPPPPLPPPSQHPPSLPNYLAPPHTSPPLPVHSRGEARAGMQMHANLHERPITKIASRALPTRLSRNGRILNQGACHDRVNRAKKEQHRCGIPETAPLVRS